MAYILKKFHKTCYLLLLDGKIEVFSKLRHNFMIDTPEFTTKHHISPDLRLSIFDIFIYGCSESKLEAFYYIVILFSFLKLAFSLQELHVLVIDVTLSPFTSNIVKEDISFGPDLITA